ncbi:hypothetical protein NP233_g3953 [Leucocoprinus birnbaumii]|uniref:Cytochrome P450 n=1 Tax=Leucocoprinus birnbaumii TaxID=56174 RepID=A0AAD5YTF0_9AGAR|nr:hypothetical protein NP233_g3953 [Leucocoprinus birnbaumii]
MSLLDTSTSTPYYAVAIAVVIYRLILSSSQARRDNPNRLPLPPGPKGYPIIDNLLDFPTVRPWLVYDEWLKTYGDMIYFKVLGQSFLILGSLDRTYDLFEKRSSNYSDRPRMPMLNELCGLHLFYTSTVSHRRNLEWPMQIETTRAFLRKLLASPEDFLLHVRHAIAATLLRATYGMAIDDDEKAKEHVETAEIALASLAEAGNPGSFLVDLFPAMKAIPSWVPGAGWKKKAAYWRTVSDTFVQKPWSMVIEKLKTGTAEPCVATAMIEKLPEDGSPNAAEETEIARNACAVAFGAGSDTTVSTVQSFFMAMTLNPEVQKRAQEELDRALGGRLPEFSDRPNLPYVTAVVKESMRWQLVTPLGENIDIILDVRNPLIFRLSVGVPHKASEADEYDGYYIPKDTIVIGNSWSILHDPTIYKDPFNYSPERFLKDGKIDPAVRDPTVAFFGFGRRICPGRFLSQDSMFILISSLLSVFDIKPGLDNEGKEVKINPQMTNGLMSYPEPFKCRITPRSTKAEQLIHQS